MRITIDIPDALYRELLVKAAIEKRSLFRHGDEFLTNHKPFGKSGDGHKELREEEQEQRRLDQRLSPRVHDKSPKLILKPSGVAGSRLISSRGRTRLCIIIARIRRSSV